MPNGATSLYEYIKGLLKYVGADADGSALDDEAIIDLILSIENTQNTKEINGCKFKSVEEIIKHLKQAADEWHLNQLSRIVDESNNKSSSSDPGGKVYNLRNPKKFIKEGYIYY